MRNHGLHGLNGFSNVDLAAKAADFPDGVYLVPYPGNPGRLRPNPINIRIRKIRAIRGLKNSML